MMKTDKILPLLILIALIVGVAVGMVCKAVPEIGAYIIPLASWMGTAFLNMLKAITIPLVFCSLVSGVMSIGSGGGLGRLGAKTMGMYMLTSIIAIIIGLMLVNLIQPGAGVMIQGELTTQTIAENQKSIGDIVNGLIPSNIFESMASGEMLHIIIFAMLVGIFATKLEKEKRDFLNKLFTTLFDVMMKITSWVITLAPLGIFGIIVREVSRHDNISTIASSLGVFVITVAAGLAIHFFIVLPLLVRFMGRANPFAHMKGMSSALLTAFSTASSTATLPLTMAAVENNSGVSNRVSSFCLPLGATVNMDGTALFECVAAIFIAQAYGIELTMGAQLVIVFTALLTSIGTAGIPMASMVMLIIILSAVGIPLEGLSIIMAVDFLLDMMRTTTNIWSDSCIAVIIAKSEGEELKI